MDKSAGNVLRIIGGIPGLVTKGFKASGAAAKELIAPAGAGQLAQTVGGTAEKLISHAPALGIIGGTAYLGAGPAARFVGSKVREFRARQGDSAPYYDTSVQRFM